MVLAHPIVSMQRNLIFYKNLCICVFSEAFLPLIACFFDILHYFYVPARLAARFTVDLQQKKNEQKVEKCLPQNGT